MPRRYPPSPVASRLASRSVGRLLFTPRLKFFPQTLASHQKKVYICGAYRSGARYGVRGRDADIMNRKRLLRLFLVCVNLANSHFKQEYGNGRCLHRYDIPGRGSREASYGYIIIQREASALLLSLKWAMREPLKVGRAQYRFSRFFYTH